MEGNRFSKGEAIGFGWHVVKNNLGLFIGLMLITFVVNLLPQSMSIGMNGMGIITNEQTMDNVGTMAFVSGLFTFVLELLVGIGLINVSLKFCDNKKASFGDFFSAMGVFLNYLVGSILYSVIVVVGYALLVVPGVIWGLKFQYYNFFIVEKGLGPVEALRSSAQITQGQKWNLFLLGFVFLGVNLLGLLAFGIGLVVSIPVTMVANAYVYRKLRMNF